MSVVDIVNLISSLTSLVLAIIAIWLSLHFYDKSKDSEKQTEVNVNEIKTQTKALTDISSRMLDKYTDYATKPKAADESFLIIAQLLGQTTFGNVGGYSSTNLQQLRAFAISMTIGAFHYSGLTNQALQDLLPENRGMIDETNNFPQLLENSKSDFMLLRDTLADVDSSELTSNELFNLYQITTGWDGSGLIRNMDELYPIQG